MRYEASDMGRVLPYRSMCPGSPVSSDHHSPDTLEPALFLRVMLSCPANRGRCEWIDLMGGSIEETDFKSSPTSDPLLSEARGWAPDDNSRAAEDTSASIRGAGKSTEEAQAFELALKSYVPGELI